MVVARDPEYLISLFNELRKLPTETEWVEFKYNNHEHEKIGEYISALANSASLLGKVHAYLLWGIDNRSHDILGTTFSPSTTRVGNEELENWILRLLKPKIDFRFFELSIDGKPVVMLEIGAAFRHPVQFRNREYIRVGSYKKKLKDFPEKERDLWRVFDQTPFESQIAAENIPSEDILQLIDYPSYFDLLELPLPESIDAILSTLQADEMVSMDTKGKRNITNLALSCWPKNFLISMGCVENQLEWWFTGVIIGLRQFENRRGQKDMHAVLRA